MLILINWDRYIEAQTTRIFCVTPIFYQTWAQQNMNHLSTSIVQDYLSTHFLPHLQTAIQRKIQQQNITARMPKIVAQTIIHEFLATTLKNNSLNPEGSVQVIPQVLENAKEADVIKIPKKKKQPGFTSQPKMNNQTEHSDKAYSKSNSRVTTQCSNLIKLAEPADDESEEVRKMRKIKELMRKYEDTLQKNRITNERNHRVSGLRKKQTISHCQYHHTYGYQAEILEVNPLNLQNYEENKYEPTLLEKLKSNLDAQLQSDILQKKISRIQKKKEKQTIDRIPACKIETIQQDYDGSSRTKSRGQREKNELVQSHLRPLFKFEESNIKSLTKDIENDLAEGVKMITHQHSIVEDSYPKKQIKIKEETVVKEKLRNHKQKTNSSQSMIYALENELKNNSLLDYYSQIGAQSSSIDHKRFRSLQLSEQFQPKSQEYSEIILKQDYNHSQVTDSQIIGMRLPRIGRQRKINFSKQRTATQQKLIRGIEGIQVKIKTSENKQSLHFSKRPRHCSALALNKETESSLDDRQQSRQHSKECEPRSKRDIVKDYFHNYKAQFRQRIKGIEQVINLYG